MPMKIQFDKKQYHRSLSLVLFCLSLLFPAYYLNPSQNPQPAWFILLIGWLGPLAGHYAWYANPAFLISLMARKRQIFSSFMGFLALFLALSFLTNNELRMSAGGRVDEITGYGWGYCLWLSAMIVFTSAETTLYITKKQRNCLFSNSLSIVLIPICLSTFGVCYFFTNIGPSQLIKNRNKLFKDLCQNSGEIIYKHPDDLTGLFFDPVGGDEFTNIWFGRVFGHRSGSDLYYLLNQSKLEFIETRDLNKNSNKKFERHYYLNDKHEIDYVDVLLSKYYVITTTSQLDDRLKIIGKTVKIISANSDELIATSSYVFDRQSFKYCGPCLDHKYSVEDFIFRTFNTKK